MIKKDMNNIKNNFLLKYNNKKRNKNKFKVKINLQLNQQNLL